MFKKIIVLVAVVVLVGQAVGSVAGGDYRLGPEDEIEIRVWGHDDLTRKIRVGLDGNISFPFVGEIKAQGLSILELQRELEKRLGPRYIINPNVSIAITEFKSKKFFVVGNVNKPGTYPLTKPITVVEAISLAGGLATGGTGGGGTMAYLVRAKPGQNPDQPRLPDRASSGEKVQVSLSAAMVGDAKHNLEIKNGDTVYVPALFYYVEGQVKQAGRFPYQDNMTVLMAVTTAGGFTDKASPRRTHIIREQNGKKEKVKTTLDDHIQPGDVIVVPESWF